MFLHPATNVILFFICYSGEARNPLAGNTNQCWILE